MTSRHGWIGDIVVRHQLGAVEQLIQDAACNGGPCPPFHRQLISTRGKRLRPVLLLGAARYGDPPRPATLLSAAAGIELLHEATLYHDDIVDEAARRRGKPSVQAACGPPAAACAGSELLFATAGLFADLPLALRRMIGRTADRLCHGQLREVEMLGDAALTAQQRIRIMRDKTAALFVLAARIGAGVAGVNHDGTQALVRFAGYFGLFFQLMDDVRDLTGPRQVLGRPLGADLRDGVYTLPILYALDGPQPAADTLRRQLLQIQQTPTAGAIDTARVLVRRAGGIGRAQQTLAAWRALALDALGDLEHRQRHPPTPVLHRLLAHLTAGPAAADGGAGRMAGPAASAPEAAHAG